MGPDPPARNDSIARTICASDPWTCPVFALARRSEDYAAGVPRRGDACCRYYYCSNLIVHGYVWYTGNDDGFVVVLVENLWLLKHVDNKIL